MSRNELRQANNNQLYQWIGWFLLGNVFLLWCIGSYYLDPILTGFGDLAFPTSLNELDSNHPRFFVFIFFTFFAFTGYIGAFILLPALVSLSAIVILRNRLLVMSLSILAAFFAAFYLFIDSRVYSIYHLHLSLYMLPLVFGGDVQGLLVISWLEWLYLIGTVSVILIAEIIFSYVIWRYLIKFSSYRYVKLMAIALCLFFLFSLQISLYTRVQLFSAKMIGFVLLSIAGIYLYLQWKQFLLSHQFKRKLIIAAIPVIILLLVFHAGALCANFTPHQVGIFLAITLICCIGLYILFRSRISAAVFTLFGVSILLLYQMFVMEYVGVVRQVIEVGFILPFYDKIMLSLFPSNDKSSNIYRLNETIFIQPKGVNAKLRYPLNTLHNHPPVKPYNILMIIIDTWRDDYQTAAITPRIHHFAQTTLQYMNHWSGGNATQPGMFSLFYGLPATYWTAMLRQQRGPLLIHELLKNDYVTGIFSSSELAIPPLYKTTFLEVPNLQIVTPGDSIVERDAYINVELKNFLANAAKNNKPFFSVMIYDGAHGFCGDGNPIHKFQPELKTCGRFDLHNDTDPVPIINRYKNALYRIDGLVGEVLDDLAKKKLLKNTIVIITGDHGEEFNDNKLNYWEHANNFTRCQVQVPFIVYWPGKSPRIINSLTNHFDVAPTLLTHVLGYSNPASDYSTGVDLFAAIPERQYMLVSSYIGSAIIESDRITTIMPDGEYEILSRAYRPLVGARLHNGVLRQALLDMVRYYAHHP